MRHGRGGQQAVGQTLPRFWHSCKKGGRGKNYFIFAIFFAEPIFALGMKPIIHFFSALFFADNNTLCQELIIFANLENSHGIATSLLWYSKPTFSVGPETTIALHIGGRPSRYFAVVPQFHCVARWRPAHHALQKGQGVPQIVFHEGEVVENGADRAAVDFWGHVQMSGSYKRIQDGMQNRLFHITFVQSGVQTQL